MVRFGNSELGSALLGTAPLTTNQVITCWVLGFSTLIINPLVKQVPMPFFYYVGLKMDLENEDAETLKGVNNAYEIYSRKFSSIVDAPI